MNPYPYLSELVDQDEQHTRLLNHAQIFDENDMTVASALATLNLDFEEEEEEGNNDDDEKNANTAMKAFRPYQEESLHDTTHDATKPSTSHQDNKPNVPNSLDENDSKDEAEDENDEGRQYVIEEEPWWYEVWDCGGVSSQWADYLEVLGWICHNRSRCECSAEHGVDVQ